MPDEKKPTAPTRTRYRVFQRGDDGGLRPITTVEARTPQDAVKQIVSNGATEAPPQTNFTVIPERNVAEITVSVETQTKVVFK